MNPLVLSRYKTLRDPRTKLLGSPEAYTARFLRIQLGELTPSQPSHRMRSLVSTTSMRDTAPSVMDATTPALPTEDSSGIYKRPDPRKVRPGFRQGAITGTFIGSSNSKNSARAADSFPALLQTLIRIAHLRTVNPTQAFRF